jgi:hypothetical protein
MFRRLSVLGEPSWLLREEGSEGILLERRGIWDKAGVRYVYK